MTFQLSAVFIDTVKQSTIWSGKHDPELYSNRFRVTVKTEEGTTSFKYHGSHHDYLQGIVELNDSALLNALFCFVSDAVSGSEPFSEFCRNFGYEERTAEAEKVYKACQASTAKLHKVYSDDVHELLNELDEVVN